MDKSQVGMISYVITLKANFVSTLFKFYIKTSFFIMNHYNNHEEYERRNGTQSVYNSTVLNPSMEPHYEQIYDSNLSHMAPSEALSYQKKKQMVNKRAAQNRAAQKAFRQRKDQHIKDLETKAKILVATEATLKVCKKEIGCLKERLNEIEEENSRLRKLLKASNSSNSHQTSSPKDGISNSLVQSSESDLANLFDLKSHRMKFTSILPLKLMDPEAPDSLNNPDEGGIDNIAGNLDTVQLNSSLSEKNGGDLICCNCNNPTTSPICICPRPIVQFPLLAGRRFKWMRSQNRQGFWRWYKPTYK
ncbi:hypothetical protein K502DRAFT_364854 [Neoconidiobolus thromboides FSU 785]|nr:hypothetical protein K502DRAFT_364854 [Neoconidiobolus thromboides FSU 785]